MGVESMVGFVSRLGEATVVAEFGGLPVPIGTWLAVIVVTIVSITAACSIAKLPPASPVSRQAQAVVTTPTPLPTAVFEPNPVATSVFEPNDPDKVAVNAPEIPRHWEIKSLPPTSNMSELEALVMHTIVECPIEGYISVSPRVVLGTEVVIQTAAPQEQWLYNPPDTDEPYLVAAPHGDKVHIESDVAEVDAFFASLAGSLGPVNPGIASTFGHLPPVEHSELDTPLEYHKTQQWCTASVSLGR